MMLLECFRWSFGLVVGLLRVGAFGFVVLVGTVDWQQLCSICFCFAWWEVDTDDGEENVSCCLGIFLEEGDVECGELGVLV